MPITVLSGMGIDYNRIERARQGYQAAADSAALSALSALERAEEAADDDEDGGGEPPDPEAVAAMMFSANVSSSRGVELTRVDANFTQRGARRTMTVSYAGSVTMTLGAFVGMDTVEFSGVAEAVVDDHSFVDLHFALDTTGSMGLGATPEAMDALRVLSAQDRQHRNCAFACHGNNQRQLPETLPDGSPYPWTSQWQRAKDNGVQTRFDVVVNSFDQVIDGLADLELQQGQLRLGVWTVATTATQRLRPTADHERALTVGHGLTLGGGTNMDRALQTLAQRLGAQGSGATSSDPRKVVVLVTDGVTQINGSSTRGMIDLANCRRIQDAGIPLAVIEVKYLEDRTNGSWRHHVGSFYDEISPRLRACATHQMYFQANDASQIAESFRNISGIVREELRLIR